MMNPNVIPTSSTVEDMQNFIPMQQGGIIPLQNLDRTLDSPDYLDTLNAMRYLQGQGISSLYPMQEGGMMEEAMMQEQQIPLEPLNPEEAMIMEQVEQQDPRQPNPEAQALARQVASYGRGGDKLILHVRPDELQGLASMLTITINPETGMPEAFFGGIRKFFSNITKPIRRVIKSKAFKTIAPIALAIAAPYAAAYMGFGVPAAASGLTLTQQVAAMSPLAFGTATGVGSLAGNLLAGRSFGDAAKAGLISGGTAGLFRGASNKFAGKTFMGDTPTKGIGPVASPEAYAASLQPAPQAQIPDFGAGQGTLGARPDLSHLSPTDAATAPVGIDPAQISQDVARTNPFRVEANIADVGNIDPQTGMPTQFTDVTPQPLYGDVGSMSTKGVPSAGGQTLSQRIGEYIPESVKDISSAIYEDFNPLTKKGALNLLSKGVTGDLGASYLDMEEQNRAAEEAAENQLRNMGYSVVDAGFGAQRVIMDPSGVTLPASLTAAEILQRALGGGRRQYVARTTYEPTVTVASGGAIAGGLVAVDKEEGGLIGMARGGEFSGIVPGQGHGMEDNVYMPIKEGPKQIGTLAVSPKEYVVDAHTMAALGNGNPAEGARVMDKTIEQIRKKVYGTTRQPNEIDGLDSLVPLVQGV